MTDEEAHPPTLQGAYTATVPIGVTGPAVPLIISKANHELFRIDANGAVSINGRVIGNDEDDVILAALLSASGHLIAEHDARKELSGFLLGVQAALVLIRRFEEDSDAAEIVETLLSTTDVMSLRDRLWPEGRTS